MAKLKRKINTHEQLVAEMKKDIIMYEPKYKELDNNLRDLLFTDDITKKEYNEVIDFYFEQNSINKRSKRLIRKFDRKFKPYIRKWLTKQAIFDILETAKFFGFVETELEGTAYDVSVVPRTIVLKRNDKKSIVYLVITLLVERDELYRITVNTVDKIF